MRSVTDSYVIYTIPRCPWCSLLQQEFRTRGVAFSVTELTPGKERDEFKKLHNISQFPQTISPEGSLIGGHAATVLFLESEKT